MRNWEKGSAEAKCERISSSLFADDTTIVGTRGEIEEGVNAVKEVMNKWEERNNDDKEEVLEFGTDEGGEVRMLGSWLEPEADVNNRIRRGVVCGGACGSGWWGRDCPRGVRRDWWKHLWRTVCCMTVM